jgi:hypothetical protein
MVMNDEAMAKHRNGFRVLKMSVTIRESGDRLPAQQTRTLNGCASSWSKIAEPRLKIVAVFGANWGHKVVYLCAEALICSYRMEQTRNQLYNEVSARIPRSLFVRFRPSKKSQSFSTLYLFLFYHPEILCLFPCL